jgi:FtsH-binding integral membrane protein
MIAGQWALWGVLMTVIMGLIDRSRRKARRPSERNVMRLPLSILIVGLVCSGLFGGVAVLSNLYPNRTVTWWTTAAFIGFAAMGLPIITGYFLERHRLSEDGIAFRNFLGMPRYLAWSELHAVRYAPVLRWFRLTTHSGTTARVSIMLIGLPAFARHILRRAPESAFDEEARVMLNRIARGELPPTW